MVGRVVLFVRRRGFGFIEVKQRPDVFFHVSNWSESVDPSNAVGRLVTFELAPRRSGKQQAIDIRFVTNSVAADVGEVALGI